MKLINLMRFLDIYKVWITNGKACAAATGHRLKYTGSQTPRLGTNELESSRNH